MRIAGKLLLLTGAAGTGKSTLAKELSKCLQPLRRIDFGQVLLDRKVREGHVALTYEQLRRDSARLITPDDVRAVDQELIDTLPRLRRDTHILIDSHAVTQEEFGYRVTHYSFDQLRLLAFDVVIVTYCQPSELIARRQRDPRGRPPIDPFEALHHMALQEAVALNYAITCGCRCVLLDTTTRPPDTLAAQVAALVQSLDGSSNAPLE